MSGCDQDARGLQLRTKEIEDFIVRTLVQIAIAEVIDRMADGFERAALLGGRVDIRSVAGRRTEVRLTIPLKPVGGGT